MTVYSIAVTKYVMKCQDSITIVSSTNDSISQKKVQLWITTMEEI